MISRGTTHISEQVTRLKLLNADIRQTLLKRFTSATQRRVRNDPD